MQAWKLLTEYNKRDVRGGAHALSDSAEKRAKLREALLLVARHPWAPSEWDPRTSRDVLMGILASDVRLAVRALRDWSHALQVDFVPPVSKVRSPR